MKTIVLIFTFLTGVCGYGQQTTGTFSLAMGSQSTFFRNELKDSVLVSFRIANAVFNSPEFRDSLAKLNFPFTNHCIGCTSLSSYNGKERINGQVITDSLNRHAADTLQLVLKKRSRSSLGKTCPGNPYTTAYFKNITADMEDIPFTHSLAVNLCHEYMHHIGFCHVTDEFNEKDGKPDPVAYQQDLAYRIGWISYYIIRDWYVAGKKP